MESRRSVKGYVMGGRIRNVTVRELLNIYSAVLQTDTYNERQKEDVSRNAKMK